MGIRKYESKRLRLYTDIDADIARPLPELMDRAYDAWVAYFGPLPPDREGTEFVITGYLMGDKALFRETGLLPEDLPPFPHGRNRGTRFWINDQSTDYYRRHLLLHEGTHCFMTAVRNPIRRRHVWYFEGMAELFGTHRFDSDGLPRFGLLPDDRDQFAGLGRIRLIEDERRVAPPRELSDVMDLVADDFLANAAYAWSWGLCRFLDGHPRYHDSFQKSGRGLTRGERNADWSELLENRDDLEEEWLLFAANLCHGFDQSRAAIDFRAGEPLGGEPATITIAADRGWQSSAVVVERGKTYEVAATGRFIIAHAPQADDVVPDSGSGSPDRPWESEPQGISFRYHAGRPLGMLLGAIRASPRPEAPPRTTMLDVIPIGRKAQLAPATTGTLYLRLNDAWSELADNAGEVQVTIRQSLD